MNNDESCSCTPECVPCDIVLNYGYADALVAGLARLTINEKEPVHGTRVRVDGELLRYNAWKKRWRRVKNAR